VKQCTIAVNSVINWSFFYYICCFSKQFQANKYEEEYWKLDTWRHRASDHSTRHRPLPNGHRTSIKRFL